MEGSTEGRRDVLMPRELQAVAAAVSTIVLRCQQERALRRLKEELRARRRRTLMQADDGAEYVATSEAVVQLCYALGYGVIPCATPRCWVKCRTGGTWEDLRQCDDATDDYLRDKLRMSPRVFREIAEACAPHLQRRVTFYREPLQPDQIVAYALYMWASRETYESSTCNFGTGRASRLIAVRNVTAALLRVFGEKIAWPTGVRKLVLLRAFADKGFPNCHGRIDCTHIYVDKPANAPSENYYDRKRRFSIVAQVVVDLDLRVLDVHMGYPGSCHDIRVLHLSSLSLRAEEGLLFRGPPVTLSFGVKTNGYVMADNGYPPSEWMVVPYEGINQHVDEERFDNKQKVARRAVERAFGRLKGMWRLFLRTHKTNLDTLPQQFTAMCILHNILIDVGIPFDENLLWEVDANGVRRRVDFRDGRAPSACVASDVDDGTVGPEACFGGTNETRLSRVSIVGGNAWKCIHCSNGRRADSLFRPALIGSLAFVPRRGWWFAWRVVFPMVDDSAWKCIHCSNGRRARSLFHPALIGLLGFVLLLGSVVCVEGRGLLSS
ncbi:hypothetical protein CBR_g44385 [Chara braunii]|uniref:DDE Tnp4 domain-containing protein n=1 Tax=Chara braunii TaxID=69332 RepID=A0A388LXE7_CHABU|nr:hypothetical protein CBR_g44385 [Chara braunii]|eukprot:GBG86931.1 hypothetical protein CBR_g44385 [Chara braunii]